MILVLTGTAHGREAATELGRLGYRTLCSAATVLEAAEFGIGQTVSGLLDYGRLERLAEEYPISGVLDALPERENAVSCAAAEFCADRKLPCLRYAPCRAELLNAPGVLLCGDYAAAARELNRRIGSSLLFLLPAVAKRLAQCVLSRTSLYLASLKGAELGMELALQSGLPLKNILQLDGLESSRDIADAIRRQNIQFLLCHDDSGLPAKMEAAHETGAALLVVGRYETACPETAFTLEGMAETVHAWNLPGTALRQ